MKIVKRYCTAIAMLTGAGNSNVGELERERKRVKA
jgi:hypothetical protein